MATSLARNLLARAANQSHRISRSAIIASSRSSNPSIFSACSSSRWFSSYPPHEVVGMPSLSPTMESGTISAWNVEEGSSFAAGDVICSVETDKATVDFEAQDEGVVAKILAEAGAAEIDCGTPILVTVEDEGDVAAFQDFVAEGKSEEPAAPAPAEKALAAPAATPAAAPVAPAAPAPSVAAPAGERVFASPRAHTLAKERGHGEISALRIVGTGPGGRIVAQDVLDYDPSTAPAPAAVAAEPVAAAAPAAAATTPPAASLPEPVAGPGYTDYSLPPAALELASRLAASKQNVPHYYLSIDLALDSLLDLRSNLNSTMKLDEDDGGITVNDLLMKAAAAAMKTVPAANASWMDGGFVRAYDSVDVNVVVGNGSGLYAPVIRDVGRRGLKSVSDDVALAASVVEGGDDPATVPGFGDVGTFTMVNLGAFGVKSCAPVIREPQACALALGVIENRIVPNDVQGEDEEIYKESVMMTATLSCDHRVVDGAVGAQWLSAFKNHVENPVTLLL